MMYQLPTGRVVNLTLEQYLNLTDEDIQMLIAGNYGDSVYSPWHGSVIKTPGKIEKKHYDEDIDYDPDYDEKQQPIIEDDTVADDLPDAPEDMTD